MKSRILACLLLGSLAVSAQAPADSAIILVSLIDRPVGREVYSSKADGNATIFTADLDLTERNGRLQVSSSMRLDGDSTPTEFSVKGKSYRFVNVDTAVKVAGGIATVTSLGETKTFEAPRRFFTAQSYAPLSARAQLINYWEKHGKPENLPVIPGDPSRYASISERGSNAVVINGRKLTLRRFSVTGVVWGRETVWIDDAGRFAAIVSRIHILPLDAVREDLKDALPELKLSAIADRMEDLARHMGFMPLVADADFVIAGARLIDGSGRPPVDDAIVVVRDRMIVAVGPRVSTAVPKGSLVINARGMTLLPGLWDMHAHAAQIEWLPAYLAAGVTSIRDMGGEEPFLTAMRDTIASGKGLGPRVLLAGLVDGDAPGGFGAVVASTPEQGRTVVDRYKKLGFEQMKLYSLLQPDVVSAITARAHELGMSVTGHIPTALGGIVNAVEAGMDHVAHLPINGDPESPQTRATIELLAKRKTVIDPTLPWNELLGHAPETTLESFEPGFAHAPPELLANYRSVKNETDAVTAKRRVRESQVMVKALFDAGVPIVAGTDGALPGYSLLRSLEMYVEAGLTPMQAIESATRVPAEAMGLAKTMGTIEVGKRADMILLSADPLADIKNVRKLQWVFANGRGLDPILLWQLAYFK